MRDLPRAEKDAVVFEENPQSLSPFLPKQIQITITTQKLEGKIVCQIERRIKFIRKGGVEID